MDTKFILIKTLQKIIKIKNKTTTFFYKNKKYILKGNEKFVILKLDRIGDAVWTIFQIKLLKKYYPNLQFDIICNKYNYFVFEENKNLLNNIYKLNTTPPGYVLKNPIYIFKDIFFNIFENKNLLNEIRYNNYDFIINQTNRKGYIIEKLLKGKKIKCYLHKEIGAKIPWCGIINNFLKDEQIFLDKKNKINIKKVLIFIGGKYPNSLNEKFINNIYKIFKNKGFEINLLSDNKKQKNKYILDLKNTFYVGNQKLKDFIQNYDLIVGPDGGVMHYISLYKPVFMIYTSTNLFSIDYIKYVKRFDKRLFFESKIKNAFYITQNLPCVGCFQIGCKSKPCQKIENYELNNIVNFFINYVNQDFKNSQ